MNKHTPTRCHDRLVAALEKIAGDVETPWKFASIAKQALAQAAHDGTRIAAPYGDLPRGQYEQIPRDIVTAVNHHEALVNALQHLLRCLALHLSDLTEQDVEAFEQAEKVLTKAQQ